MSNKRSAPDGLKLAAHLWRSDRDAESARSILDDLLARYPDSDEAAAASNLLEEINDGAMPTNETTIEQSVPWRKARIFAGLLTIYVGVQLAGSIILQGQIASMYSFLAGVMSGLGGGILSGPGSLVFASMAALPFLIGGIYFCGKRGRGRKVVWIAALLSVPLTFYSIYLGQLVPGYQSNSDLTSLIIAPLISIYLIWALRKTAPDKERLMAKASRSATPKYAAAAIVVVGIVLAMTYSNDSSVLNSKKDWEPKGEVLAGLSAGMSRSEVYRVKGAPYALQNEPNRDWDTWHFTTSKRPDMAVRYVNDLVTEVRVINLRIDLDGTGCGCFQGQVCAVRSCRGRSSSDRIPFNSVAQMHEILGMEDILATSRARPDNMYTYAKWGVSYEFTNDALIGVAIGTGNWRNYRNGDYFVKGQQVCPSDACPWDDEGELKPEFQGSNYMDFLGVFSSKVEDDPNAEQTNL